MLLRKTSPGMMGRADGLARVDDDVVVHLGVGDALAAGPEVDAAEMVGQAVVDADVVAADVVFPRRGPRILAQQVAAAVIVVGQVVLENRAGGAAIQIESPAVGRPGGGLVVVRDAMLDHQPVAIPAPDAHRSIARARHVPAVVEGLGIR
jgi:hypothetical protein